MEFLIVIILPGHRLPVPPTNDAELPVMSFADNLVANKSVLLKIDIFKFANDKGPASEELLHVEQRATNFFAEVVKKITNVADGIWTPDQFSLVVVDFPWMCGMGDHDTVPGTTLEERRQSVLNMLDMASKFVAVGGIFIFLFFLGSWLNSF